MAWKEQWTWINNNENQKTNDKQKQLLDTELDDCIKCKYLIVRLIVLLYPKTSAKMLEEESNSLYWLERYAIAQNPNTSLDIVQELANDANRIVRAAAKENLLKR